jgi:hypothetical protein
MDFKLIPRPAPTSAFQGYVLNATDNKAIPDAVVTFYNELTRDWGSATTDQDGSYKISVHAGYYSVRIWAPHHFDGVANLEIGQKETQRQDFVLEPGEKRYGYWGHGGYAVADKAASPGPPSSEQRAEGPPMPSQGQRAYVGAGGGLGPYQEVSAGGKSPGFEGLLVGLALIGVAFGRRWL